MTENTPVTEYKPCFFCVHGRCTGSQPPPNCKYYQAKIRARTVPANSPNKSISPQMKLRAGFISVLIIAISVLGYSYAKISNFWVGVLLIVVGMALVLRTL